MANKIEAFPILTPFDDEVIENMLEKTREYLSDIYDILKIDPQQIRVSKVIMREIIERIEKRKIYFRVFYDGCKMGELNEVALLCFWILKLTPFYLEDIPSNILNAKIALCLFMKVVHYHSQRVGSDFCLTENLMDNIYYAFRFRDLSKEAIMLLAESLIS